MATARDVMTPDCACISEAASVFDAATRLADESVGALPICGEDDRLKGMITDRDIVVDVIAQGRDPKSCTVSEFSSKVPVTIGADDDLDLAVDTMIEHGVRRLPVIDGDRLIGIVAQADLARELSSERAGELLAGISG